MKKILPIITIAGAATIVTPFITSCNSNKTYEASWNYEQGVYAYTTEKHKAQELTGTREDVQKQAAKMYFEAAEDDPLILAEDIVQKMSYYQLVPVSFPMVPVIPLSAKASVSSVSYEDGYGYATFDVEFYGITIDDYDPETGAFVFDVPANGKMHFENLPMGMYYSYDQKPYEHFWDVNPHLEASDDWDASLEIRIPAIGIEGTYHYDSDSLDDEVRSLEIIALSTSVTPDYCYYLNDVSAVIEP